MSFEPNGINFYIGDVGIILLGIYSYSDMGSGLVPVISTVHYSL